jgi:hypothetical protein
VATEADAARERVLAARSDVALEIERLEASARAAVDVPAKVRRNPVRTAAIVGGAGFVALGGPRRLFRRAKAAIVGPDAPLPEQMLPEEIEKALKRLGTDGARVRGTLERDFADYVKAAHKRRRPDVGRTLYYSLTVPLLRLGAKAAANWLTQPDQGGFAAQLERLRGRPQQPGEPIVDEAGRTPPPTA